MSEPCDNQADPMNEECSVIIPISERFDDIKNVHEEYASALSNLGISYHFYYVLDGEYPDVAAALNGLSADHGNITVLQLARWFGEATALAIGFDASRGSKVITLPPYMQINADNIGDLIAALETCDIAVARRVRDHDTFFNRLQSTIFNWTVRKLTGESFHDLGCSARSMQRTAAKELQLYGDQHRFLPLLASRRGFRVQEVPCRQATTDQSTRFYHPGVYIRRALDIMSAFFLFKFTKKPLRFFGLLGTLVFVAGSLLMILLVIQRFAYGITLGDRPLLLLAALLVVLGIQIFAIGLVGEIIIYTHAKDMKEYNVETVVSVNSSALQKDVSAS